jgi:hypothetical protein
MIKLSNIVDLEPNVDTIDYKKLFFNGDFICYYAKVLVGATHGKTGVKKLIYVTNENSDGKALSLIALIRKLDSRQDHITGRLFIDTDVSPARLYQDMYQTTSKNSISGNVSDNGVKLSNLGSKKEYLYSKIWKFNPDNSFVIGDSQIDQSVIDNFNNVYYNNVISMKEQSGVTLYSSSKVVVDIVNGSVSIDLVEDDVYTNTISLVGIETKISKANLSGKIDLTVKYTKEGIISGQDLTFKAFKYTNTESPELTRDDFISPLGSMSDPDVMVEYVDGVIRVIPESSSVDECVISNCVLTYGCN